MVPKGYRGAVVSTTDRVLPKSTPPVGDDEVEEVEEEVDVKIMEEQSDFDHIMLWGHEALPDEVTDPYVRGIEEWIALAGQVCFQALKESNLTFPDPFHIGRKRRVEGLKGIGLWRF